MAAMTSVTKPTLIVTRPVEQASELISHLALVAGEQLNISHLPLLEIQPNQTADLTASHYDGAIFVSSNAVHHFYQQHSPSLKQLVAVGEHTASSIADYSRDQVIYPQQMNAEGLLALPELDSIAQQHWLVVKGIGGRPIIAETLRQRGAIVTELEVYRRKLPNFTLQKQIKEIQTNAPVWLISSAEALTNLHRILGLADIPQHSTKVIISSERLKNLALQKGFTIFAQSAGASEIQLVQCVKTRFNIQE